MKIDPKKYVNELFTIVDTRSILVYTPKSNFKRIYCPFNVMVTQEIGQLQPGQIHAVNAVKMTLDLIEVYIIGKKAYPYYHFKLYM